MTNQEINALVAEKVLGLEVVRNKKGDWSLGEADYYDDRGESILFNPLPNFWEDIEYAWVVVGHVYGVWDIGSVSDGWVVRLATPQGPYSDKFVNAKATTVTEAICRAALKSVGVEV